MPAAPLTLLASRGGLHRPRWSGYKQATWWIYDHRRDKNHENPHVFVVFFRAASGWLQSRRIHPGMIVYLSSNIVGVLGDVFGHQAPLTRPLEVIRVACSTSGEEERNTN